MSLTNYTDNPSAANPSVAVVNPTQTEVASGTVRLSSDGHWNCFPAQNKTLFISSDLQDTLSAYILSGTTLADPPRFSIEGSVRIANEYGS